ncbi:serine/threonine-protein phosphatase 7 long form homolog [Nicotiana tabacum]|uniref:Serine/threonine-protein phosphatase 7 long form homolog n=1 Tax=Nicotiana tabacum TaxID=4097 RepID=A0AC58UBC5_TOBAC
MEIGRLQLDWSLITTLIEQWRPETHTFHLSIGEATITLQDVEVLYGLPVDGHYVALPNAIREYTILQYLEMLQRLTGFQPLDETALIGASCLQLTPVHWGAAVLGYLYRKMCRASMGTQRDVAGFLPMLQVWAWKRNLQLQPPLLPLALGAPPLLLPLARRWVDRRGYGREYEARHNLPYCWDLLEGAQFIWRPYNDELIAGLPDYCSTGRIMWSSSVPLMCLDIVEHHATERGGPDIYDMARGANRYLGPAT